MRIPRLGLADGLLDLDDGVVHRSGRRVRLTEQEQALLKFLAMQGEDGATRDQIHRDVFGYLGTTRSRAADHAIKRLRKKLELDPSAPRHLLTLKGGGYLLRAHGSSPNTPDLIGRASELQHALAVLQNTQIVAVTGMGGIGKTSLARAVARSWQGTSLWVHVAGAADLDDVIAAIGATASVSVASRSASEAALYLAKTLTGTLVVLDECEGCLDAVTDLLTLWALTLIPPRTLLTSRAPPVGLTCEELSLGPLVEVDALALLTRHEAQGDLAVHRRLVHAVGGHPQALEIAACGGAAAAHAEIGEVVRWAWQTLRDAEQQVLVAATLFPRGATIPLLGEVVDAPEHLPRSLRRLLDLSLLRAVSEVPTSDIRLAAPETVRRFVSQSADLDEPADRFVAAMHALAERAATHLAGARWLDGLEDLRAHHLDLREAVGLATARRNPVAVRIALTLEIVDQQFATREAQARLWDAIATLLPTGDDALDDRAALTLALSRRMWGSRRAPWNRLDVAARAERRGDVEVEVVALEAAAFEPDNRARPEILARCEALYERDGLPAGLRARLGMAQAVILRHLGQLERAGERCDTAAELVRTQAGRLRHIRLHAALLQVDLGNPRAAAAALAAIDHEPWSRTFRLSRSIMRSAEAWATAQSDPARALPLFAEAELGFDALTDTNEVVVRHRIWTALTRLDSGAGAELPVVPQGKVRGRNLCGMALLWCVVGHRDLAIDALKRAASTTPSAYDRAWIETCSALAVGSSLPEVTLDDPVLHALVSAFAQDPRRRAAAGPWRRRSLWLRAWHRAAAQRRD